MDAYKYPNIHHGCLIIYLQGLTPFKKAIVVAIARDLARVALWLPIKNAKLSKKLVTENILFLTQQYVQN